MRLLLLANIFPTTSNPFAGSFIKARIQALKNCGYDVDCIGVGGRPRGSTIRALDPFMDGVVGLSRSQRAQIGFRGSGSPGVDEAVDRISGLCAGVEYHAVMAHGMYAVPAGRVGKELAARRGIPYSVHLHGSDVNVLMPRRPAKFRDVLEDARAAIFVSKALLDVAVKCGYSGRNAVVTGNGIDPAIFNENIAPLDTCRFGAPVIGFVGNLERIKGADRLRAIHDAIRQRHQSLSMIIVGDGPLRERLEAEFSGTGVHFAGRMSIAEVARVMAAVDVLVLPSRNEGWPTVINESYAVGTPVVASGVGGVREAVINDAAVVDPGPGFADRVASAVDLALANPRSAELRERAQRFSWSSIVRAELAALGLSRP